MADRYLGDSLTMTTEDLRCGVAPAITLALSVSRSQKRWMLEWNAALSSMTSHRCMHENSQREGRPVITCCSVFQEGYRRRRSALAHAPGFSARARSPGSSRPRSQPKHVSGFEDARDRHLSFPFTLITVLDYLFTTAVAVRAALHQAQPRQFDMGMLLSARDGRNFRC
jgi:hypothetical protein